MQNYKIQILLKVKDADWCTSVEFADLMLNAVYDNNFLGEVMFRDEATFHGHINRHYCYIWEQEWPREFYDLV